MHDKILEDALNYAQNSNWAVFSVHGINDRGRCTCENSKCDKPGKHPWTPNGLKNATKSPDEIYKLFKNKPHCNIGVVTGEISGFLVIDVDGEKGRQNLKALTKKHSLLPKTLTVQTGRGLHLYYKMPDGIDIRNSVGKIAENIDVRANGGYIIAPPSRHKSGKTYEFKDSQAPLAELPDFLLRILTHQKSHSDKLKSTDWLSLLGDIKEGSRNDSITKIAGKLIAHGLGGPFTLEMCFAVNKSRCSPPLSKDEVEQIVNSISGIEIQKRKKSK